MCQHDFSSHVGVFSGYGNSNSRPLQVKEERMKSINFRFQCRVIFFYMQP
jgi:hypothetical protein